MEESEKDAEESLKKRSVKIKKKEQEISELTHHLDLEKARVKHMQETWASPEAREKTSKHLTDLESQLKHTKEDCKRKLTLLEKLREEKEEEAVRIKALTERLTALEERYKASNRDNQRKAEKEKARVDLLAREVARDADEQEAALAARLVATEAAIA